MLFRAMKLSLKLAQCAQVIKSLLIKIALKR